MESIASKPVKCSECFVWWRGMEHRCSKVAPRKPNFKNDDNWKTPTYSPEINNKIIEKIGVINDQKKHYTNSTEFIRNSIV